MSGAADAVLALVFFLLVSLMVPWVMRWFIGRHERFRAHRSIWVLGNSERKGPAVVELLGEGARARVGDCTCWRGESSCGRSCVGHLKAGAPQMSRSGRALT